MAARKKAGTARRGTGARRTGGAHRRGKLAPRKTLRGPAAADISLALESAAVAPLVAHVRDAGGVPIGAYREPLSGRALLVATLPLAVLQPTPFQRDLSPTHTARLAERMGEVGLFLDPLIVVRGPEGGFSTPNGRHRLAAAKVLGMRQVTVLICPDPQLAYRILALNTEKAHNLRDRSLEAIRMARSLALQPGGASEQNWAGPLEAPELLTLGLLYESSGRFAGGAYNAFLRKVDRFSERPLAASLRERHGFAARLLAIDAEVKRIVAGLQARGIQSPYLRNYVVARINPVRFIKPGKSARAAVMPMAQALTRMSAAARTFKLDSVSHRDLAWVAVGAAAEE
ncbi:MAG: ParB N-terminal domain-containing protein [Pseudomonadota bacterium]|nr:ParB N-terminal domain-containing protein [Pseudomonadota bacterium]